MLSLGFSRTELFLNSRCVRESFEVDDTRSVSVPLPFLVEVDGVRPVSSSLLSSSFSVSISRLTLEVPAPLVSNEAPQDLSGCFCGNLTTLLDAYVNPFLTSWR